MVLCNDDENCDVFELVNSKHELDGSKSKLV